MGSKHSSDCQHTRLHYKIQTEKKKLNKKLIKKPNEAMKLLVISTLAVLVSVCLATDEILSKKEATQLLDDTNGRYKRAALGASLDQELKKIKKKWSNYCKFNSVEKWDEFQDELEETTLPEKEVDRLERCTSRCARKDEAMDLAGRAYEEKREKQEEKNQPFKAACEHCFKVIPKSGGFDFLSAAAKKCKNSRSGSYFNRIGK